MNSLLGKLFSAALSLVPKAIDLVTDIIRKRMEGPHEETLEEYQIRVQKILAEAIASGDADRIAVAFQLNIDGLLATGEPEDSDNLCGEIRDQESEGEGVVHGDGGMAD